VMGSWLRLRSSLLREDVLPPSLLTFCHLLGHCLLHVPEIDTLCATDTACAVVILLLTLIIDMLLTIRWCFSARDWYICFPYGSTGTFEIMKQEQVG